MGAIFGIYEHTENPVNRFTLLRLAEATLRYAPDSTEVVVRDGIGMVSQAFWTTARARMTPQSLCGSLRDFMIAFDGRLDNYLELAELLSLDIGELTDGELIASAYSRWGEGAFPKLLGDFSFALWDPYSHSLYLVRDHAGTRPLYFSQSERATLWSTHLETFYLHSATFTIDKQFLERHLVYRSTGILTPYEGIVAVPAAHYVRIRGDVVIMKPHWNWVPIDRLSYRDPLDYDEHFLSLFRGAIKRRTPEGCNLIAELSGGMDSTSIVCMSDWLIHNCPGEGPRHEIDTVSYFDDSEPDWDERPYVEAVERHRNKSSFRVDFTGCRRTYESLPWTSLPYPYVCGDRRALDIETRFEEAVGPGKYRVILSGVGGDELLGGVPTPLPELADYVRLLRPITLLSQAAKWGIATRTPLYSILGSTLKYGSDLIRGREDEMLRPPWMEGSTLERRRRAVPFQKTPLRIDRLPSSLGFGVSWWSIVENLPHAVPRQIGTYEYRYPYLDRELVDFLGRVPREELVKPNRRRALMRRALKGVTPETILERRRKAIVSYGPLDEIRKSRTRIEKILGQSHLADLGLIDVTKFRAELAAAVAGDLRWVGHLTKAIDVELWLMSLGSAPQHSCDFVKVRA